jgi:pSer/pThr/pTyr-binding forkhead associated (FHA) protein
MHELILELVGKNTRWSFNTDKISIGRDPNCDLVLPTESYPMVSRSHLLIRMAGDRYWADDLKSSCGTFINEVQLQGVAPLSHGDIIQLGGNGPQLKVYIGVSQRSDGQETPSRKRTLTNADTTQLRQSILDDFLRPLHICVFECI